MREKFMIEIIILKLFLTNHLSRINYNLYGDFESILSRYFDTPLYGRQDLSRDP